MPGEPARLINSFMPALLRSLFCLHISWVCLLFTNVMMGAERARLTAPWPPPEGQIRVIIDADMNNEIDDQYALALALGNPDRLKIEGVIAAHYGKNGEPDGIEKSFAETGRVLERAGLAGKFPVLRGINRLRDEYATPTSDGVEFIIAQARSATPEKPLWLILLGPATDGAAALLRDPSIADRIIIFWHSRSSWPKQCGNFNAKNDRLAAQLLFSLNCRLVLFDTGENLTIPMEESARRFGSLGPLGAYLQEIRLRSPRWQSPKKGVFDLGDIAAFLDVNCVEFERTLAPLVRDDFSYDFSTPQKEIVRIHKVNRERSFVLLEESLHRIEKTAPPLIPAKNPQ